MKKKMTIILLSTLVSFVLISGGYGFWEKELTLGGIIIVEEQEPQEDVSEDQEASIDITESETKDSKKQDNEQDEEQVKVEVEGQIEDEDVKVKDEEQEQEIQEKNHQETENAAPQTEHMEEE